MFKRIFTRLTIRLETFTHIVPLPFAIYFSVVTGSGSYISPKEFIIVALAGTINASALIILGCIWRWIYLKGLFKEIKSIYKKNSSVSDLEKQQLKIKLLKYPFKEGIVIVLRWITGIIGSHLIVIFLSGIRPGLHLTAPFLFLMIVPISYIAYFFISENIIRSLFKLRKIKGIEISREQIPQFNSFQRILFSIVSITIMPIIILGYMLYGFRTGLVLLEEPGLHLLIMSVLFPVPIIIVGYVVAKTFSNGIQETNEHLSELGKGKFSIVSMPTSSDDFGLQSYNMNQIIKRLNSMYSEIRDLNSNLEEKVIERTAQVNEMLGQLGELYVDSENKRKEIEALAESRKKLALVGQLAAGIVHDIKNPMATIKYLAQKANVESISREKREKNLNMIVREMDRLNDLAYEILDYSKGNLNLEMEEILASDFLLEIEQFLRLDFEYNGIQYSHELEYNGKIRIDKDRMRRVIINLAKNAIEAMQDGLRKYIFKIRIEKISFASNQDLSLDNGLGLGKDGFILISLIDNGPGIPESIKSKIFEAFATEGKVKGTGLGLFMCKMIVDAHNGSLTYKSEKDKGTIFMIQLPI